MSLLDASLKAELAGLYEAAGRHYHGMGHVRALLAMAEAHAGDFADPEAVEAAIWFHDAVYDTHAKDSEARSAALAAARLSGRVEAPRLARIVAMIEATATHRVPDLGTHAAQDAALFLDMDLSILGAPPALFDAYEAGVRLEYGWVPEERWRQGRAAVLAGFLERERIFHTDLFRGLYEAQARANLRRSLERLAG